MLKVKLFKVGSRTVSFGYSRVTLIVGGCVLAFIVLGFLFTSGRHPRPNPFDSRAQHSTSKP